MTIALDRTDAITAEGACNSAAALLRRKRERDPYFRAANREMADEYDRVAKVIRRALDADG